MTPPPDNTGEMFGNIAFVDDDTGALHAPDFPAAAIFRRRHRTKKRTIHGSLPDMLFPFQPYSEESIDEPPVSGPVELPAELVEENAFSDPAAEPDLFELPVGGQPAAQPEIHYEAQPTPNFDGDDPSIDRLREEPTTPERLGAVLPSKAAQTPTPDSSSSLSFEELLPGTGTPVDEPAQEINEPAQVIHEEHAAPTLVEAEAIPADETDSLATSQTTEPDIEAPQLQQTEAVAPETVAPETAALEAVAPETAALEAVAPETAALEAVAPEAVPPEPDAAEPGAAIEELDFSDLIEHPEPELAAPPPVPARREIQRDTLPEIVSPGETTPLDPDVDPIMFDDDDEESDPQLGETVANRSSHRAQGLAEDTPPATRIPGFNEPGLTLPAADDDFELIIDDDPLPQQLFGQVNRARRPTFGKKEWFEKAFTLDSVLNLNRQSQAEYVKMASYFLRLIRIAPPASVLDLCCGTGNLTTELARRNYKVIGLDLSVELLRYAYGRVKSEGLPLQFAQGDMRELDFEDLFDVAINCNTSFGYFDDMSNFEVLRKIHRCLKPKGKFLLDVLNRDYILQYLPQRTFWKGDQCTVLEEVRFNHVTSQLVNQRAIIFDGGRQKEDTIVIRLYSLHELLNLLSNAGFEILAVTSGLRQKFFLGKESQQIIIVAQK